MNQTHYSFQYARAEKVYEFFSQGKRGKIKKVVQFKPIHEDVFNLGFGDFSDELGLIDDTVVTDNGDMEMIFATVIAIIETFLLRFPDARIFLTGSTESRIRLYQIIINMNLEDLQEEFEIHGFRRDRWERFRKNIRYESFLVSKLL
jgi:hypothetical protein